MADAPELKHCPFCGGDAAIDRRGYAWCKNEQCAGWTLTRCTVEQWNTRTAPTRAEVLALPEVAALVEKVTRVKAMLSPHYDHAAYGCLADALAALTKEPKT